MTKRNKKIMSSKVKAYSGESMKDSSKCLSKRCLQEVHITETGRAYYWWTNN